MRATAIVPWVYDTGVPTSTVHLVAALRQEFHVKLLCGTRQCHRTFSERADALEMLRVPELLASSGFSRLGTVESLTALRLRLLGQAFENAVGVVVSLASLVDAARAAPLVVVVHPLASLKDGSALLQWASALPSLGALTASGGMTAIGVHNSGLDALRRAADAVVDELRPRRDISAPPPAAGWAARCVCAAADCASASGYGFRPSLHPLNATRRFHLVEYGVQARDKNQFHVGDVFQSLAVAPYLPRVDLPFIEHHWHSDLGVPRWPSATDGAEHVAFLNARWEGRGQTDSWPGWPPPPHVTPVFLAFRLDQLHLSASLTRWLQEASRAHPIGTRDAFVADELSKVGVRAFVSGDFLLGIDKVLEPRHCDGPSDGPAAAFLSKRPTALDIHDCARKSLLCNRTWRGRLREALGGEVATYVHAFAGQKGGRDDTWPAGGVATERGESYDLLDRGARQQLALDRLRAMRDVPYIVSGPTPYYHTLIPAAGLGTPALDISSPSTTCKQLEGNETRFVGLEALVDDLYDGSCERAAPALQRGVDEHYNASLHRLLARSSCDGTALPPKGVALKRRLVAAQRRAAAERHPSIFDAMHRLGLVTGGTREQRDAAWVEGRWVDDSG